MTNILQTEFYRLKKSRLFWALFGVSAGLPLISPLLSLLLLFGIYSLSGESGVSIDWQTFRSLHLTTSMLSEYASVQNDASLLAVICTGVCLSRNFAYGTYRNMLLAKHSRLEIYLSDLLTAMIVGASYIGVSIISSLLFGGLIFGFGTSALNIFTAIITSIMLGLISIAFAQTLLCMFLFGTRKTSVALSCTIVICLVAPSLFEGLVQMLTLFEVFGASQINIDLSWVPLYNSSLLDLYDISWPLVGKIVLYLVPLSVFFGFMGWITFRKADLK